MSGKDDNFEPEDEYILELTEEQYEQMMHDLEAFDQKIYESIAETSNYEIIPTTDDKGTPLNKDHYSAIKRECFRHGLKVLYAIDTGRDILVINPETMKIGIISSEIVVH